VSSLINCMELLQSFTNNVKLRHSLIYLTVVSQFYSRGTLVNLRRLNFEYKQNAFLSRSKRAGVMHGCLENGLYFCTNSGNDALWLFACLVCCCWVYNGIKWDHSK
jgi:hypothetical protein